MTTSPQDIHYLTITELAGLRSTTSAARAAVMNELHVAPAAREVGIARVLIDRCASKSVHRGAPKLTWLTRPDNYRVPAVHDPGFATRDPWIIYRIGLRNSTPAWP
jgi:predicted N-acetyltransferase YhbS